MNELLDAINEFFADRPGLIPLVGVALVLIDLLLQVYPGPGSGWFVDSNILMHLGIICSTIGLLLIRAWN